MKLKKALSTGPSKKLKHRVKKLKHKQNKHSLVDNALSNGLQKGECINGDSSLSYAEKAAVLRKKQKKKKKSSKRRTDLTQGLAKEVATNSDGDEPTEPVERSIKTDKKHNKAKHKKERAQQKASIDKDEESGNELSSNDDTDSDDEPATGPKKNKKKQKMSHREQLEALMENDEELRDIIRSEDADLLDFNESDVDSDLEKELDEEDEEPVPLMDGEEPIDEEIDNETETITVGKRKLRIRTDDNGRKIVDIETMEFLETILTNPNSTRQAIGTAAKLASKAFVACVARVGASIEKPDYVVNSEKVFEGIVRLCFTQLGRCLMILLDPVEKPAAKVDEKKAKDDKKKKRKKQHGPRTGLTFFKKWRKHSGLTKEYLNSVLNFLVELQHNDVICSALRAIVDLADLYTHFAKTCRQVVKTLVRIWSRKMERARALAFVALCKLARLDPSIFPMVYKSCYVAYVSNSRTVTAETWPLINFMQKSFAELTFLDASVAYQYAFVYVRQYAIHLRNAIIAKRKDLIQTVYNWQFMQGLYLWATVLGKCPRRRDLGEPVEWLKELIYPLVQIVTGFMKVFPTSRYLPLRLHCIRLLLQLQVNCKVFIPTLALSVELLTDLQTIDEKKPSRGKGATRVVDMKELLKLSKEMLDDAGYRQRLAEELFQLTLEAAYVIRGSIAFPQIVVPISEPVKAFIKACRNPDHTRLFKSLLAKIRQHAENTSLVVAAESVDLKDYTKIEMLEQTLSSAETALALFYKNWRRTFELKLKNIAEAEEKALQKLKVHQKGKKSLKTHKHRPKKPMKKPRV